VPVSGGYPEPIPADLVGAFFSVPVRDAVPTVPGLMSSGRPRQIWRRASLGWRLVTAGHPAIVPGGQPRIVRQLQTAATAAPGKCGMRDDLLVPFDPCL